ncbi:MAG TPA: glycosyltransferase family 1 protein [Methylocella sp.]|nr:glycosyltransferase family 1 protein [Methylocella sp.]
MTYGLSINGRFLSQRPTGVQRYAREIVVWLDRLLHESPLPGGLRAKLILPAGAAPDFPLESIAIENTKISGSPLWTQLILPFKSQGVLLSLGNVGPVVRSKQIVCIHDVNTFLVPESYSFAFRAYYSVSLRLLARRSASVTTVSHYSARMLSEYGLRRLEDIAVIPNGHEHVKRWNPERSQFSRLGEPRRPFIFVLGSRAVHKNVEMLFSIARELDAAGIDLWVAGAPGLYFSRIDTSPPPPNVRMLGFISDDDLAALYRQALCFAFPSLTEGFGLPALEAMALGCPVVASNAASLPEVCGDAALFADPRSPRDWLCLFMRLRAEPDLARSLREKGMRQALRFSWKESAQAYLSLIIALLHGKHPHG